MSPDCDMLGNHPNKLQGKQNEVQIYFKILENKSCPNREATNDFQSKSIKS